METLFSHSNASRCEIQGHMTESMASKNGAWQNWRELWFMIVTLFRGNTCFVLHFRNITFILWKTCNGNADYVHRSTVGYQMVSFTIQAKKKRKVSSAHIYLGGTCPDLAAWPTLSTILATDPCRWRRRAEQWFTAALMRTEVMLCFPDRRDTAGRKQQEKQQNTLHRGNMSTSSQCLSS